VIVAHAYGIPAVWQKFSDTLFGDDVKYQDYFESVALTYYKPMIREKEYSEVELQRLFETSNCLPQESVVENLRNGLMGVCPFINKL
jgi:hypothetical protein